MFSSDFDFVSMVINFTVGGFCILYGYFTIRFQSLKLLSGYDEKSMPYIDKRLLSRFIGMCLINAGLVVIIPNLIVTVILPDLVQSVGIISYVIFTLILIYMVLKTNREGRPGGKFSKKE